MIAVIHVHDRTQPATQLTGSGVSDADMLLVARGNHVTPWKRRTRECSEHFESFFSSWNYSWFVCRSVNLTHINVILVILRKNVLFLTLSSISPLVLTISDTGLRAIICIPAAFNHKPALKTTTTILLTQKFFAVNEISYQARLVRKGKHHIIISCCFFSVWNEKKVSWLLGEKWWFLNYELELEIAHIWKPILKKKSAASPAHLVGMCVQPYVWLCVCSLVSDGNIYSWSSLVNIALM